MHEQWLKEIENFFTIYKTLENNKIVSVDAWSGVERARQILKECFKNAGTVIIDQQLYGPERAYYFSFL